MGTLYYLYNIDLRNGRCKTSNIFLLCSFLCIHKQQRFLSYLFWSCNCINGYGFLTFQTTENPISLFLRKGNFLLLLTFRIPILCNGRFLFSCFVQKPNVSRYIIQQYNGAEYILQNRKYSRWTKNIRIRLWVCEW